MATRDEEEVLTLTLIHTNLEVTELLSQDEYATFKGKYEGKTCVVKIFDASANDNNEFQILEYLQLHSLHPEWFPKPYLMLEYEEKWNYFLPKSPEINLSEYKGSPIRVYRDESGRYPTGDYVEGVWKIIIYEYIEGRSLDGYYGKPVRGINETRFAHDVTMSLLELHRLDLLFSDLAFRNIIETPAGDYRLIDFGRTHSISDYRFPVIWDYNTDLDKEDELDMIQPLVSGIRDVNSERRD